MSKYYTHNLTCFLITYLQHAQKSLASGSSPRFPSGELTAFHRAQTPSWIKRGASRWKISVTSL